MSGPFGSTAWMYSSGDAGFYDFPITNSVRLGGTGHLTHTNSSDSASRQKFTFATWLKITSLSTAHHQLFDATNNYGRIYFTADDDGGNTVRVLMGDGSSNGNLVTTRKFRDTSSWYHIVVAVDTTEGTAGDRIKIYINGVRETSFAAETDVNQNVTTPVGGTALELIGAQAGPDTYFKGYLAETHYIVNAQLTAASFGETKNDIWVPKDTAGLTYGTNGYRLQYKQTGTSADSSGIGADTSGNDNHWTPVNLVAGDVVPDSPTNNFATLNPLAKSSAITTAEGNLEITQSANHGIIKSTIAQSTGKWYCEVAIVSGASHQIGVALNSSLVTANYIGHAADGYGYYSNGNKYTGGSLSSYGASYTNGDVMGIALDMDGGTVTFYKNNASQGTAFSSLSGSFVFAIGNDVVNVTVANFGQDSSFAGNETAQGNADGNGIGDFYYAPPSGYLALCTANLPDPVATVDPAEGGSPQDYFNTVLYTGSGGTQSITGVGFESNFNWIKGRNNSDSHNLEDTVRGKKRLFSNTTGAEVDGGVDSRGSDGFTLTDGQGTNNESGHTYVAWNWKAGTAFSNDASATGVGSIDSSGSVNTDVGFSIITYTGNGTAGATIAHGLSAAPEMIITKGRNASVNPWYTFHNSVSSGYLTLSNTNALTTSDAEIVFGNGSTAVSPTSSVFTIGTFAGINENTKDFIAYCFHSVDGYSKIGSYIGNGNADGPFVYTGFRPAWVMVKRTNDTGYWPITNNKTLGYNPDNNELYANTSQVEATSDSMDYLSNGFKLRWTSTEGNANGSTYIYMAFSEQSFKYSNAR
jgi:hypothetical protein